MNRLEIKTFIVEGAVQFPLDMLRYDCAWPATPEDADLINRSLSEGGTRERIRVRLHAALPKYQLPADERWRSFCWRVVEVKS